MHQMPVSPERGLDPRLRLWEVHAQKRDAIVRVFLNLPDYAITTDTTRMTGIFGISCLSY